MALNLALLLAEGAARRADATAFIQGGERLAYGALHTASNRTANALRALGVQRGDNVGLILPNVLQFPIIYFAILKLGATAVPLLPDSPADEICQRLQDCSAQALFVWHDRSAEILPCIESVHSCRHSIVVNAPGSRTLPHQALSYEALLTVGSSSFDLVWAAPDDTAVIQYTAAVDGATLGAQLTHANLLLSAITVADRLLHLQPGAVGLAALPLSDVTGQTWAMNALLHAGGAVSLLSHAGGVAAARAMARDGVTYLPCTPDLLDAIVAVQAGALPSPAALSHCVCLGATPNLRTLARFEDIYGVRPAVGLGLTETCGLAALSLLAEPREGSIGKAVWGTDIGILDADGRAVAAGKLGELCLRGCSVLKGYHGQPEASAHALRHDWLHTGVSARKDVDGYVYLDNSQ